ncbi:MAG TPA: D-alanyl-D-alanine carboxypeptidase [Actinomycetota bacterium]|nr:D-alanyl-D-alanine carboxypeptidase [Actinomycetota bacterium]
MARRISAAVLCTAVLICVPATAASAGWRHRIDRAVKSHPIGVSVRFGGRLTYHHADKQRRAPASNEKLLMSMALMDRLGPRYRVKTIAAARATRGTVAGDLWLLGRGDPTVTGGGKYARHFTFEPTRLGPLARRIKQAGVRRINGSVMGSTGYFERDWFAQGWKATFPAEEVAMPTALSFDGNESGDRHVVDGELRAARSLTQKLRSIGVRVQGSPGTGPAPGGLPRLTSVASEPIVKPMTYMNRQSSNFFAEVFGKRLGAERYGVPGSIDKGARAIASWTRAHGVRIIAYDSSGLSYDDRVSPRGMAHLLQDVERETWWPALRSTLPSGNQGTLEDRLRGVKLRAKTGTLDNISALSGWVWLDRMDTWGAFSILSGGMTKTTASEIEDRIVRILASSAH